MNWAGALCRIWYLQGTVIARRFQGGQVTSGGASGGGLGEVLTCFVFEWGSSNFDLNSGCGSFLLNECKGVTYMLNCGGKRTVRSLTPTPT